MDVFQGGKKLKARREQLKLDQNGLASRSGVSQKTISRLERGEIIDPGVGLLRAVSEGLSTPLETLLEWYEIK